MTLETSLADAAPTRRSRRRPSAPTAPEATEHQDQVDEASPAGDTTAIAEAVVAVGITAALAQAAHAEQPPLTRAELRRRRAAESAAAAAESAEVPPHAEPRVDEPLQVFHLEVVDEAKPSPAPAPEPAPTRQAVAADLAGTAFAAAPDEHPDLSTVDFDFAAQLFSFTGKTPVQVAAEAAAEEEADATTSAAADHLVASGGRVSARSAFRRLAAMSFSMAVMGAVGLLAVGTTTPASVAAAVTDASADITVLATNAKTVDSDEIQAYVAAAGTETRELDRPEAYDIASMADIAADSGVTQFAGTWVNDPAAAIQWPFPVGVPVSAAYGSGSYLAQFSSPHRGVDLTPGTGAEVHVIADGTVRLATEAGGDYGVNVVVDHVIDGQQISTRYAHMQYGSLNVSAGDTVSVGDVLGTVGSTGKATGPHLHFEVLINGTVHTDPYAWMRDHTKG